MGVSPLIVIVRRHTADGVVPEVYVLNLEDEIANCHLTLGERHAFYPPRAPKNGHLTVLSINERVRLAVANGKVPPARQLPTQKPAVVAGPRLSPLPHTSPAPSLRHLAPSK